jgi:hypothetical protein
VVQARERKVQTRTGDKCLGQKEEATQQEEEQEGNQGNIGTQQHRKHSSLPG